MSYIGLEPSHGSFDKQLITGDGSTVTFTLEFPVAQAGQLLVSLDGIIQEPEFSFNISLSSGSPKINFASAPSNGSRIFIVFLGRSTISMVSAQASPHIDEFDGNGSTTAFTLHKYLLLVTHLILSYLLTMFIRGMVQVMHTQLVVQL